MATFNVLEAAVRWGVPRFVNVSSETVPGFFFPEREVARPYAPIDEDYPALPQDPYALAKHFGEQLMDAATRRSDIRCISIRPSWVQWEGNYERNLGPFLRDPDEPSASFWSYIDVYDLADSLRLAAESDLPGHEVFYIASPDNCAGRPLAEMIARHHGDAVELRRARPRGRVGDVVGQGDAHARLRAEPLVARLPDRGRARCGAEARARLEARRHRGRLRALRRLTAQPAVALLLGQRLRVLRAVASQRPAGHGLYVDGEVAVHDPHGGPGRRSIQMIVSTLR